MAKTYELNATIRDTIGQSASKRARREGFVPAVMYGGDKAPVHLCLSANQLKHALEDRTFYSSILDIKLDKGAPEKAVLKALQRHPSEARIVHLDLLRIDASHKITLRVPLNFIGMEKSPGVAQGGVVSHVMNDIEIKCMMKDLPEAIEVDLSKAELNHIVHVSDLKLPKGVELAAAVDSTHNLPVASIHAPKVEVEPETVEVVEEVEATAQTAAAETPEAV